MDIINGAVLPRYAGPAAATRTSDGDGAAAANFDASGEKFVDSSIIEAVELRTVSDGFVIKMRDGKDLRMRCVQNNPRVLRLRDSAPHHAIVLKMEATFCSRLLSGCIDSCLDTCHIAADTFLVSLYVHATSSSGNTKYYAAGCTSEHSNCKI
ncbi:hypothetical protein HU200_046365 [Digitaria exilis]|uniref:Uncharacterized protein n=1 Tax=Digitaria exilis TaxID=1010633 RepID=A0A835B9W8_9POAL|nr:hypothetical protein HU200_046365 [Digitaria exilis]